MEVFKAADFIRPGEDIGIRTSTRKQKVEEHTHDFIEIVYILNGKGVHFVNKTEYQVSKGDMIYIGIDDTHAFEVHGGGLQIVEFFVRPEFINDQIGADDPSDVLTLSLFREFATEINHIYPFVSFSGSDLLEVEFAVNRMVEEYQKKQAGYATVIKGYFHVILAKMLREIKNHHISDIDNHFHRFTPEILQYIEQNCFEKITLAQLAEKFFYNPAYFSRIFKDTFGQTLVEYITDLRVKEAVKLLDQTTYSVEEICQKVGYCDTKRFYKVFKEKIGVTPGGYRKGKRVGNL